MPADYVLGSGGKEGTPAARPSWAFHKQVSVQNPQEKQPFS